MRGCNYTCSNCVVPFVRGREVYRSAQTILNEVREQVNRGAKEIMLLGQTVNSYRSDQSEARDFSDLLKSVSAIEGVKRLKFMSPHPYYFSEKLIETIAQTPAACEHIHLPLQSGSDRILGLMRRNYDRRRYREIIAKLRQYVPKISITTDIIAGFPTESEDDFKQTLNFMEEISFNSAYCFKFSPRAGTQAALSESQLPQEIIEERLARLLELTKRGKAIRLLEGSLDSR
ncbi:MAG: MiaB/RimO family radical SAM methylthiotransferase [Patescibacteria group bacterium]